MGSSNFGDDLKHDAVATNAGYHPLAPGGF